MRRLGRCVVVDGGEDGDKDEGNDGGGDDDDDGDRKSDPRFSEKKRGLENTIRNYEFGRKSLIFI